MAKTIKALFLNTVKKIVGSCIYSKKTKVKQDKKILSAKFMNKNYHMVNGATLTIKSNKEENIEAINSNVEKIAKQYLNEPEKLFSYIENMGTIVHINKYADKLLSLINEKEGFIYPKKGIVALYLNLILNGKISFTTNEMFVLRNYNTVECVLLYQFYNWYNYKYKTKGFETETQNKYKNIFKICSSSNLIDKLSFEDLMLLKTAVRRDIEAIEFVEKYITKNKISKNKLEEIKTGKLVKI